jgi:hypothetical protein
MPPFRCCEEEEDARLLSVSDDAGAKGLVLTGAKRHPKPCCCCVRWCSFFSMVVWMGMGS